MPASLPTATPHASAEPRGGPAGPPRFVADALAFSCGAATMALEIAGARLLAPSFGMSMPVWATLIGFTLAGLAVGNAIGGWAMRVRAARVERSAATVSASRRWVAAFAAGQAGLYIAGSWAAARPLLDWGAIAATALDVHAIAALLAATAAFLALPTILLGAVLPLLIGASEPGRSPRTGDAGRLLAWSTIGSLAGTFGTAFGTLPILGTRLSLAAFGGALALVSAAVLIVEPRATRPRHTGRLAAVLAAGAALLLVLTIVASARPPAGHGLRPDAIVVAWREGRTHYIEVVESAGRRFLLFDEGAAVQSIYDADRPLTGTVWDDMAAAPALAPGDAPPTVRRALVVGLAGGTVARTLAAAWPGVQIDGVEIDPDVVDIAREHLYLDDIPGLIVHVADGRVWMNHRCSRIRDVPPPYDLIALDAYRGPYPPFHLMTREFFALARRCLSPGGVIALNLVDPAGDGGALVGSATATLATAFGWVGQIERPDAYNRVLVASGAPPEPGAFDARRTALSTHGATNVARAAADGMAGRWRMSVPLSAEARILSDDQAPVERLVEADVWQAVR